MIEPIDAIARRLAELAASLPGATARSDGTNTTWSRDGRAFVVLGESGIEFDLGRQIARAAIRTPDTTPSRRGDGWVRFAPTAIDAYAMDRAASWFEAAWRGRSHEVSGA